MKKTILLFTLFLAINSNAQILEWATSFSGSVVCNGVVTSESDEVFTVGSFANTCDFDPGTGVTNLTTPTSASDGFVVKQDPLGNLLWAKQFTGNENIIAETIRLDNASNIYISGSFDGTADFDPGAGVFNLTASGDDNVFIVKLDPLGDFIWAVKIAAFLSGEKNIALDNFGNIFITGSFNGTTDFDPGAGIFNMTSAGSSDIYVLKLNNDGIFIWAKQMGGTSPDQAYELISDSTGNIYVTGRFWGTADFDPGIDTYNFTSLGGYDGFIAKLDSAGNFLWANQIGGVGDQKGANLSLDINNDVLLSGTFSNSVDFDPGAGTYSLTSSVNPDIFITKLDSLGNFKWARQFVGTLSDAVFATETDSIGNVYTLGLFVDSVDFDPGAYTYYLYDTGNFDTYVSKLDSSGNFEWAFQLDNGSDLELYIDNYANIYTCGYFGSTTDFDPTNDVYNITPVSPNQDGFTRKMSPCQPSSSTINLTACNSYTVPSGRMTYTTSGTYMDTIFNAGLCDSIIEINLTINTSSSSTLTDTACYSYTSPSGNYTWTTTGVHMDTIPNTVGCDSIITTNLFIGTTYSSISPIACESYTSPSGNYIWTTSGIYMDTIPNSVNCDSVISIDLAVGYPSTSSQSITACDNYTVPSGDETYTQSGTYNDTIPTALGCDSIITINLTINTVNSSVTQNGLLLTANEAGANYMWVECPQMTVINGATDQSYTVDTNGDYAVIVTNNGCTDTSDCYTINDVGIIENNFDSDIKMFPNPTDGNFTIDLGKEYDLVKITITDIKGKLIQTQLYQGSQLLNLKIEEPAGVYLLDIESAGKKSQIRLVKK